MNISAFIGNITSVEADAIVNAACLSLEGGGGVDGAVHSAAGPELLKACEEFPILECGFVRCPTGEARITEGFNLPNKYVIHTVGPRFEAEGTAAPELLRSCYRNCILQAAYQDRCNTIAFPALSTGIFGYPLEAATIIAVKTVMEMKHEVPSYFNVKFVCFDEANFLVYKRVIESARAGWSVKLEV